MFSLRRTAKDPGVDWPALLSLLEDDDRRAAVEQLTPTDRRESYLAALRRIEPRVAEDTLAAGRRLHTAARLVQRPTIAIAGMLNSGKTSLVSTFLSPQGRRRTLRGTGNDEGTHRFVLWLPQSWRNDVELWSLLIQRIGDSLGRPPEELAIDPEEAAAQYNNRAGDSSLLSVPLLATDPGLDAFEVGLLDCPDIVSDEELGLGSPDERRRLLGRAATLCSAFVIVTGAESARDQTLADLLRIAADLMPGVPRLCAVNKVRPRQTPDSVEETFRPLVDKFGIGALYAAYDFDVPASGPFIPTDAAAPAVAEDSEPLPVFFAVSSDPDDNPPAAIGADRLLTSLPSRLDRSVLFEQLHRALKMSLEEALWNRGVEMIRSDAGASLAKTRDCQRVLLDAALEFFAHRRVGGEVVELRLHQSERIVRQLTDSFAATAPWYARWGVRLNTTLRRVLGGAGDFVRSLTPTASARQAADEIKGRFRRGEYGGLIDPAGLASEIERYGGGHVLAHLFAAPPERIAPQARPTPHRADPDDPSDQIRNELGPAKRTAEPNGDTHADVSVLLAPVERAVRRFEQDDFTTLDPRRLDEAILQMWREVPVHRKIATGLTPLAALFAAFGAALMVPIDFGANFVLAASIPELLAAAGLTTLSAMWASNRGSQDVAQQAARQQLADFLAVLCDETGVSRPDPPMEVRVAGTKVKLPPSRIPAAASEGPTLAVFRLRDEFLTELRRLLPIAHSRPKDTHR